MARRIYPVVLSLLTAAAGSAQFPTPYPSPYPGGPPYPQQSPYPPTNYPPGQYPPGQYPPGIGLPVPKLPGKKSKDKDATNSNSVRIALRAVDGTLRELGEKNLYLESARHTLFKFRLLGKTQFQDKKGEPVRDSLLKPGDQLSVQVNADDPETAVRVILARAGNDAERTAAGRPFDHDSAKTPVEADTHGAGSMEAPSAPPEEPAPAPAAKEEPTLTASVNPPPAAPSTPQAGSSADSSDDAIISAARDAADRLSEGLPDFIVQQNTTRYYSTTAPAQWRTLDVVSAEVVSVAGKEEYRNILVNGKPTNRPVEKTGAWSTGEFQTVLDSLLSPYTAATFRRQSDDTLRGRATYRFQYRVRQENSNWDIYAPTGAKATPSYSGDVWIDKATHNILRIEEESGPMPAGFVFDKAESVVEYSFVTIESKSYPLPVHSEILTCQRGSPNCTKNEINFQNYRKFGADSTVTFGK